MRSGSDPAKASTLRQFAWATSRWVFRAAMDDQEIELPLRCTWILEKREQGWILVHFYKSVGMAD